MMVMMMVMKKMKLTVFQVSSRVSGSGETLCFEDDSSSSENNRSLPRSVCVCVCSCTYTFVRTILSIDLQREDILTV